jgi:hypothetical protein
MLHLVALLALLRRNMYGLQALSEINVEKNPAIRQLALVEVVNSSSRRLA